MRRAAAAIAGAGAAAAMLAMVAGYRFGRPPGHSAPTAVPDRVPVRVAIARRGSLALWVSSPGTVRAVNSVVVRPRIDGLVERVEFRDGAHVARGAPLFRLDARPLAAQLAAARAQHARDDAQLENARRDFRRYDDLLRDGSTSAQTRDTALAKVRELEAAVSYDEAQIALARMNLSYTAIRAPLAGTIGARLVDPGNLVHLADPQGLAVIEQIRPIYVEFTLPQDRLTEVRAAESRDAAIEVRASAGGPVLARGRLVFVDNRIDAATGTLRCRGEFANARRRLWPGQFVDASLRVGTVDAAVTVPTQAVQTGPAGSFLYVVAADSVARRLPVRVGAIQSGRAVILTGLAGGERVVTRGGFRLNAATPVRVEAN